MFLTSRWVCRWGEGVYLRLVHVRSDCAFDPDPEKREWPLLSARAPWEGLSPRRKGGQSVEIIHTQTRKCAIKATTTPRSTIGACLFFCFSYLPVVLVDKSKSTVHAWRLAWTSRSWTALPRSTEADFTPYVPKLKDNRLIPPCNNHKSWLSPTRQFPLGQARRAEITNPGQYKESNLDWPQLITSLSIVHGCALRTENKRADRACNAAWVTGCYSPNGEGEIARVAFTGPNQIASMSPALGQKSFRVWSREVRDETICIRQENGGQPFRSRLRKAPPIFALFLTRRCLRTFWLASPWLIFRVHRHAFTVWSGRVK